MSRLHVRDTNNYRKPIILHDEQDTIPSNGSRGKKTGHQKHSKKGKRGRTRGPRSQGRYPFLTYLKIYIYENRPYKVESTLKQEERSLRRLHRYVQELKKEGKMSTTNPTKMTQQDIGEFIFYVKSRGVDNNTVVHYCFYMKNLLTWSGNPVMENMAKKNLLPTENRNKEIISLNEQDAATIIQDAQRYSGWDGAVLALIIPFYYYTGLRSKELLNAELRDLDTVKWVFTVKHPKAEGTWGQERAVPILPPLRPFVMKFLKVREERFKELKLVETPALIPNLSRYNASGKPYTNQSFLKWKKMVEVSTGVKFDFRMLRRTYGQHLRDRGVPIDAISKLMGHASTTTTEKYYARIRDEHAFKLAEDAWSQNPL